ncbi:MAG: carboxylating nicotinate-nucleotide diphosphorylase [Candidatus Altiarchaeales archaeon]|nr:carboxylating nicotinate-nucleotide diphosphorylase [Candidatus Altiarchaeota archaeon]MCG2783423.1 carboxylating nicotinate-nucleotide diphosphorylase [Candidatus Altiarchaeales archaeon]MBU4266581.1 carboxylating nicotinate-nucleotide diphosphorylase [Candidatus Altiarchaeota archaeon]MBU4341692.1 carboxylating nicotinate-nucleotide diphosphorylase [Candidatus Altiarchaeota archaeon]MBU4406449.1 carboxylating nicotinate-nucleotide diphosphorylase [Candidatus Altiarchaeota archaeon]
MNHAALKKRLREMVREDVGAKDITTALTPNKKVRAEIIAKEPCTVAGIKELDSLFSLFNIKITNSARDGTAVKKNQRTLSLSGNSHDILVVERTALNILSRMSGIATLTSEILKEARKSSPKIRIAATRKTTPLFGYFEKKAVKVAGGETHRMGLWDMVLIKDNHLKLFSSITQAVKKAKEKTPNGIQIEIEVTAPEGALEAAKAGADIILLDNFTPKRIEKAIALLEKSGLRTGAVLEASGGIRKENIKDYAKTGVDVISLGMLTHSAKAKDFSLKII